MFIINLKSSFQLKGFSPTGNLEAEPEQLPCRDIIFYFWFPGYVVTEFVLCGYKNYWNLEMHITIRCLYCRISAYDSTWLTVWTWKLCRLGWLIFGMESIREHLSCRPNWGVKTISQKKTIANNLHTSTKKPFTDVSMKSLDSRYRFYFAFYYITVDNTS